MCCCRGIKCTVMWLTWGWGAVMWCHRVRTLVCYNFAWCWVADSAVSCTNFVFVCQCLFSMFCIYVFILLDQLPKGVFLLIWWAAGVGLGKLILLCDLTLFVWEHEGGGQL